MRKTPFAGLTVLDSDEPLATDGASFQTSNPAITDALLQVGAVTHRHDEHDPLARPVAPLEVSSTAAGGTLPAGVSLFVGYTLVDDEGGETRLGPVAVHSTPPPIEDPVDGPDAELIEDSGILRAAAYYYAITLVDDTGGETLLSGETIIDRPPGVASASVRLTGLAEAVATASAAGWRVYRATGGSRYHFIAQGSADELIDDGGLCADCAVRPPDRNTTRQTNTLSVTVPASGVTDAQFFRLWASVDGDFTSGLIGQYPVASAGVPILYPVLETDEGAPPDVATTVRGAHRIDPATEIAPASASVWEALGVPAGGAGGLPSRALDELVDGDGELPHRGVRALAVSADAPARLRIYTTAAARDADRARPPGTDPATNSGVLLDVRLTAELLDLALSPVVDCHSLEPPPEGVAYLLEPDTTATVSLTYLPTEA